MKKPTPIQQAAPFEAHELFFSTTDRRGIIRFGNEVFERISGYPRSTLIGAAHNIIRHPDMPKAVFKLFWATLQDGQPIFAYVKNMSATGTYYWVLAFAFPIQDGYLSIRIKPSSSLFTAAEAIYARVLAAEKEGGIQAGEALLPRLLTEAGFTDYRSFMVAAAMAELDGLDQAQQSNQLSEENSLQVSDAVVGPTLERIHQVTRDGSALLRGLFLHLKDLKSSSELLRAKTDTLLASFNSLRFVSLNMAVLAPRFGNQAATLAVTAREFSALSAKIEKHFTDFGTMVNSLAAVVQSGALDMASIKVQMDSLDLFVRESLRKVSRGEMPVAQAFQGLRENCAPFQELSRISCQRIVEEFGTLDRQLKAFSALTLEIRQFINGLELIRQLAEVESARTDELKREFASSVQEMDRFTQLLRTNAKEIRSATAKLLVAFEVIMRDSAKTGPALNRILELALLLGAKAPLETQEPAAARAA